jgi:hypothetical protein
MALEIVLGSEALRPSTSALTAPKRLAVLQMMLSRIYVNATLNDCIRVRLTAHQTDSSVLCRKSDMAVLMTLTISELYVARRG